MESGAPPTKQREIFRHVSQALRIRFGQRTHRSRNARGGSKTVGVDLLRPTWKTAVLMRRTWTTAVRRARVQWVMVSRVSHTKQFTINLSTVDLLDYYTCHYDMLEQDM